MITEHHIELIQVSNSLDLKMITGPLWGLLVNGKTLETETNIQLFLAIRHLSEDT